MAIDENQYFKESEPSKRRALLEAAAPTADEEEKLAQMKSLFEIRYTTDKNGVYADTFMRAWLELKMLAENLDNYFGARRNKKRALDALHTLCLDRDGEFDEYLLYQEMCHLTARYIMACNNDTNYKSVLWGLGKVKDAKVKERINLDLERIGEAIPKYLDMEKEFRILKTAILDTKPLYL